MLETPPLTLQSGPVALLPSPPLMLAFLALARLAKPPIACERVEIETIPAGRRIDTVPGVRQEGDTTIVPVVEEVLVVERRLMLRAEIRIN